MRMLLAIGVAAALLFGVAGCKSKYEKACHNLLDIAAKEEGAKEKKKIEKARELCGEGVELYMKTLDCIAEAGKLKDLSSCSKSAMEDGMKLVKKVEK